MNRYNLINIEYNTINGTLISLLEINDKCLLYLNFSCSFFYAGFLFSRIFKIFDKNEIL